MPTPRTDALTFFMGTAARCWEEMREHAKKLERELAVAKHNEEVFHTICVDNERQTLSARGDGASEQRIRELMDSVRRNGGMYNNDEILRLQGWLE